MVQRSTRFRDCSSLGRSRSGQGREGSVASVSPSVVEASITTGRLPPWPACRTVLPHRVTLRTERQWRRQAERSPTASGQSRKLNERSTRPLTRLCPQCALPDLPALTRAHNRCCGYCSRLLPDRSSAPGSGGGRRRAGYCTHTPQPA